MKEFVGRLGLIRQSVEAGFRAIDRALTPEPPLSLGGFLEHLKTNGAVRVDVMPFPYITGVDLPPGPVPGMSFGPTRHEYRIYYKSYSATDKCLRGCHETNDMLGYRDAEESELGRQYQMRNILSASKRVNELQELFPNVKVELILPGYGGPMRGQQRYKALAESFESGLEPFPRVLLTVMEDNK